MTVSAIRSGGRSNTYNLVSKLRSICILDRSAEDVGIFTPPYPTKNAYADDYRDMHYMHYKLNESFPKATQTGVYPLPCAGALDMAMTRPMTETMYPV